MRVGPQLITPSFLSDRKSELLKFTPHPTNFLRTRKLDIVRTVGLIMDMAANGNGAGYAITAQDFFHDPLRLVKRGPLALAKAKQVIKGDQGGFAQGLQREILAFAELFATQDQREGARAFIEKRPPKFLGL